VASSTEEAPPKLSESPRGDSGFLCLPLKVRAKPSFNLRETHESPLTMSSDLPKNMDIGIDAVKFFCSIKITPSSVDVITVVTPETVTLATPSRLAGFSLDPPSCRHRILLFFSRRTSSPPCSVIPLPASFWIPPHTPPSFFLIFGSPSSSQFCVSPCYEAFFTSRVYPPTQLGEKNLRFLFPRFSLWTNGTLAPDFLSDPRVCS